MPAPNLDLMPVEALIAFSDKHHLGREYKALFPAGGGAAVKDTSLLSRYALCKALEKSCKTIGDTQQSCVYRGLAQTAFSKLSPAAKWRK